MSTQRLDELESELKILKNEIQTMLIDVREHVLSYYKNPFQMVNVQAPKGEGEAVATNLGVESKAAGQVAERSAPAPAAPEHSGGPAMEENPQTSSQLKSLMDQLERERQALNAEGPQAPPPPMQFTPTGPSAGPFATDAPASPMSGDRSFATPSGGAAPGLQPPEAPMAFEEADLPRAARQSAGPGVRPGGGALGRKNMRGDEPWSPGKRGAAGTHPPEDAPGAGRGVRGEGRLPQAEKKQGGADHNQVNLLTLVGLVRWVEKSIRKIGREKVEAIVEIYRTAGYLPEAYNDVIGQVIRLAEGEKAEGPVTMGHSIMVLLALDSLMGGRFQTESSILSTLFTDEGGWPWKKQ